MEMGMKIELPPATTEPREASRTVPDGDPMVEIDHLRFYYSGKEAVKEPIDHTQPIDLVGRMRSMGCV